MLGDLVQWRVYRIAVAYVVLAWLVVQVVETILPAFGFGDTAVRITVIVLAVGFIPVVVLALLMQHRASPRAGPTNNERPSRANIAGQWFVGILVAGSAAALAGYAFERWVFVEDEGDTLPDTASAAADPSGLSIVVAPFIDISPNADQAYFADGITEEILNLLAQIPQLRVTSRSSSFALKGSGLTATQVGQMLNVAYLLEGSLRLDGNRVRITTQLIDTRTDSHLWSRSFDRELGDIFAIQDEIAAAVVQAMQAQMPAAPPRASETDAEAFMLFLQGAHFYHQRSSEGLRLAIENFNRALEIDPTFAPAWVSLASSYINQGNTGQRGYAEAHELATQAIERALDIDPDFPLAHSARAWIAFSYERDYALSARHFRKALQAQPNSSTILANLSVLAAHLGRVNASIELASRSIALDPTDSVAYGMRATRLAWLGRFDEAEADIGKAIQLSPGSDYLVRRRALFGLLNHRPDAAIEDAEKTGDSAASLMIVAMARHDLGDAAASDVALEALRTMYADDSPLAIATVYAWRGETDAAFDWLNRAVQTGSAVYGVKVDPVFARLHADPRWDRILWDLGLADAQVADIEF